MRTGWLVAPLLVVAACSGGESSESTDPVSTSSATTGSAPPASDPPATIPPATAPPATTPPTTDPPGPVTETKLVVTGPEEVVFDWTTDRCEDEHIPDIAARAVRDAGGRVQLNIGHYVNYRMIGPELDSVVTDCGGPVLSSDFDPDPSRFNDSEWLGAPYTLDGETIYAIVHNEYRGVTHQGVIPGQCPSNENLTCLDTSLTMVVSTDRGDTYQDILPPPNHMVATMPYTFDDDGVPSGLRQPSNIIRGPDDYFYVFSNISDYPENRADFEPQWVCLMRTDDLADPSSWRYWDGAAFAGVFVDPYTEPQGPDAEKCGELASPQLGGSVNETVVFDEALQQYVMMGVSAQGGDELQWGIYYSLSDDLIEWSSRELLLEIAVNPSVADNANDLFHAYPSVIDPDSASMNFETTDGAAYLYLARFNAGGNSLDRDLLRWPIEVRTIEVPRPDWNFDADGDTEGWFAENDIGGFDALAGSLVMEATGPDPYFLSSAVGVPAAYDRVTVRMKVTSGSSTEGQLFFVTDGDPEYDESKSLLFSVSGDGEFHDYELDVSDVAGWDGRVIQLRLDPVGDSGRSIEIDRIWFPG